MVYVYAASAKKTTDMQKRTIDDLRLAISHSKIAEVIKKSETVTSNAARDKWRCHGLIARRNIENMGTYFITGSMFFEARNNSTARK